MAENNPEKLNNSVEKAEKKDIGLERTKSPEKKLSKAEMAKQEKELTARGEQAEKKLAAEKEKHELDLAKDQERVKRESQPESRKRDISSYTKAEKKTAYKKQLTQVRQQLPRGSRAFSKVVHNPVVEKVSDATAKTIFRPSVLIGGAVAGIVVGLIIYIGARYYGYAMPTNTLVLLLIVGALLGVVIEFIVSRFKPKQEV